MSHKSIFHFAALIFIAAIISCSGQDKDDMNTFEVVWKQVNETFFDSTFGGIDWRDTHDRYKLRISAAETDAMGTEGVPCQHSPSRFHCAL
jgi:hypothetical protein